MEEVKSKFVNFIKCNSSELEKIVSVLIDVSIQEVSGYYVNNQRLIETLNDHDLSSTIVENLEHKMQLIEEYSFKSPGAIHSLFGIPIPIPDLWFQHLKHFLKHCKDKLSIL